MAKQRWLLLLCVLALHMNRASTQGSGFKCTAAGFFADPNDCSAFYSCDTDLNAAHGSCTEYGHFDPVDTCAWGQCTNPVATGTFKCTASGYFADPSDCRAFYQCSAALVATRGICFGGGGFFNKRTQGCEAGTC